VDSDIQTLIARLQANNLSATYVPDRHAACDLILSLIPEGAVVGYGDSLTLRQIGVVDALEQGSYCFLNPWEPGISVEENLKRKRRSLTADVFVTGTNALTMDGQLVNVDGHGNRVAAMLFGPKKVIVVVGVNKIVPDLEAAFGRGTWGATPTLTPCRPAASRANAATVLRRGASATRRQSSSESTAITSTAR
jgi:hypothetical protein